MPRGPSGRIVVELNPALKREFHAALAADGITLKDWFLSRACDFITNRQRPQLLDAELILTQRFGQLGSF